MSWITHTSNYFRDPAPPEIRYPCYVCCRESSHFYRIVAEDKYLGLCDEHYLMAFIRTLDTYRELQDEELGIFEVMNS